MKERTQLYLDKNVRLKIAQVAKQRRSTMAAVMRQLIDEGLKEEEEKERNGAAGLLKMAKRARRMNAKGPRDLSEKVDYYLYGDGRIE